MDSNKTRELSAVFASMIILFLITSSLVVPALALRHFFNCTTRIANRTGNLTLNDINVCYDKVFTGAPKTIDNGILSSNSTPVNNINVNK
jgi:hypothetical protein